MIRVAFGCLLAALAVATEADAQASASRLPRVVFVSTSDEPGFRPFRKSFEQGLRAHGQVEGRTLKLDIVYANLEPARSAGLITQAVASRPDVLVVTGLTNARRARDATTTIPVVVATASDLVDGGVIASLARPGGNVTGISDLTDEGAVKRLELLREMLPRLTRLALLTNPDFPATAKIETHVRAAAQPLGITLVSLHARDRATMRQAVDSLKTSRVDALLIGGDALFTVNAREVIERANESRTPAVHSWPGTAEMGAVFSYHADVKPADLPVEEPTRYELIVNRKAATALGVELPQKFLLRADRVIE